MNRRGFIAALASVPVLGSMLTNSQPPSPSPVVSDRLLISGTSACRMSQNVPLGFMFYDTEKRALFVMCPSGWEMVTYE